MSRFIRIMVLAALAATTALGACDSTTTSVPSVASVVVEPAQSALIQGEGAQLRAALRDQAGNLLSGRVVTWASSAASVVSVDGAGFATALGSGSATITARSEGASGNAQVTVRSRATIQLDTNEVDFNATRGEVDPVGQTITITNTGEAPLVNLVASPTYLDGGPQGWLATSLQSTSAPASLLLSASVTGLSAGVHRARVDVASDVAGNSPLPITVTFTVLEPPPVISVSTEAVLLEAPETSITPVTATVQVSNEGGGTLGDLAVAVEYSPGQPVGWLAAALDDDTAPTGLTLAATAGSLALGTYTAMAILSSPAAKNTPVAISITFTVAPRAAAPPGA